MTRVSLTWILAAIVVAAPGVARGEAGSQPIHHSADRELWDRKINRIEMMGHAIVRQPGETLTADYITLDLNLRTLDARGNCVYTAAEALMYGEEMHFNLDTRTGTIVGGRVSNDNFTLAGERINKLGAGRYQTHWGEYSTCRDCAQSWTLLAEDVDMEFDGYASLSNVTSKIKDAPAFWLPYLIVPVKTRRQSGFLFPQISTGGENGFTAVLPFFWAIDRSADMTFGAGIYSAKGFRGLVEGRYALSERSGGKANFYYLHDRVFEAPSVDPKTPPPLSQDNPQHIPDRWALNVGQVQELPWAIDEKLKITEVSDNDYPRKFGDVGGAIEPYLASSLSFSHTSDDFSAYLTGSRFRNLLYTDPSSADGISGQGLRAFDPNTVQAYPALGIATNDRQILGSPIFFGLNLEGANFTRSAGPTSCDPVGTCDPSPAPGSVALIREAKRASVTPTVYTTFRPFDTFAIIPSAQYRSYFYDFSNAYTDLYRSYLLLQADASTQFEKIYDTGNPEAPLLKHLIRPQLTLSWIPDQTVRNDREHPFVHQIDQMTGGRTGYYFDNNDIIPQDNSPTDIGYFVPQGKSIAYGFTTQLVQRIGALDAPGASYRRILEWSAGQAFNFRELAKQDPPPVGQVGPRPLSRFFSTLNLNVNDKFLSDTTYYYYPYTGKPRNKITTTASYVLEQATHQRFLVFDRSIRLTYALDKFSKDDPKVWTEAMDGTLRYSLSDYILPSIGAAYSWIRNPEPQWLSAHGNIQFQSPSQCWRFSLGMDYLFGVKGVTFSFDFSLNLTGTGFGGISEVASQAMTH